MKLTVVPSPFVAQPKYNSLTTLAECIDVIKSVQEYVMFIPDTGASITCIQAAPHYKTSTTQPIIAGTPSGHTIRSTESALLNIPTLSNTATAAHTFKKLATGNLLSIGKLCDENCEVVFKKTTMEVTNNDGFIIIKGKRDTSNGLWKAAVPIATKISNRYAILQDDNDYTNDSKNAIKLPTIKAPQLNGIIRNKTAKKTIVQFHHSSLGSPVPITLQTAVDQGFLSSFPGLTSKTVRRHLTRTVATAKGHLNQTRAGLQSTKTSIVKIEKTHEFCAAIVDTNDNHRKGQCFCDLTGK